MVAVWFSLWTWAQAESPPAGGNATIPLVEERAYLDRSVLGGDNTPDGGLAPADARIEPGLTPEEGEQLSETFLTETSIGSIVLFGLIYRLLIK